MAQTKKAEAKTAEAKTAEVVEVVLELADPKKGSTKFYTEQPGVDVTNIYLKLNGLRRLGNPSAVKVTVEAHEA